VRMDKLRRALLLAIVLAFPATYALRPVEDNDIFFHVRTGGWILEHGVTRTDPFTVFGEGKPYVAYAWLFQVVVYEVHRAAGWVGIAALEAVLAFGCALAIDRLVARRGAGFTVSAGLTGLALVAMARMIGPRSWLFTIAFFALELDLVLVARERKEPRRLFWLVPLFVLWANLHVQFVYGLALLGLLGIESLIETARGEDRRLPPGPIAVAGVLSTLATLANPYGVGLWATVLEYAGASRAYTLVGEHAALTFRSFNDWCLLGLALAAAYALGARRERRPFPYLLLALAALLGFRSGRDGFALAAIAAATLASSCGTPSKPREFPTSAPEWLGVVALSAVFLVGLAFARGIGEEKMDREIAKIFPVEAAAAIERLDLPGPIFNDYDWGSYLIWRLPGRPVSIDGRTNLHGDERIARSRSVWQGAPGWEKDEDLSRARCVVASTNQSLTYLLERDPRFALVHQDSVAWVFSRK